MSNKLALMVNFIGIDKMSGALRNIVGLGRNGSQSLRALNGEARRLQREMRDAGKELKSATGNVTNLIEKERELARALADVNRQIDRQKRLSAIDADTSAMKQRGQDLQTKGRDNMVGGAAMAAPLLLAAKRAADYSSGLVDIQQKANLTDQATDQLGRKLIVLARNSRLLPEEMRAGFDALLSKGLDVGPAMNMIGPIGRFATAYKVDVADAANASYAGLTNLKVAAADTGRVFDMMASAGNDGSFEIRDMARHFPSLTAQLQALGDNGVGAVADLSAALQVAMKGAGNPDEAANNIQNLLGKINAPGTIAAFKKNFGVDLPAAMKKLTDQGYSSMEAIAMVTKEATKGDMKKLGFAFEDQQARMGVLSLIQDIDKYRQIRERAMKAGGLVDKQFNQRVARDASVQWKAFQGNVDALAITLGSALLPALNDTMSSVGNVLTKVAEWAERNPQLTASLMKGAAAMIALRIGIGVLQFAFGGLLGPFASVLGLFRKAAVIGKFSSTIGFLARTVGSAAPLVFRAFGLMRMAALFLARGVMQAGLMMMANPIVLAITLIVVAIGGAAYLIYTHWGSIKNAFAAGVGWVSAKLTAFGNWMKGIGSAMMQGLLMALNPALLVNKLLSIAKSGMTAFMKFFDINSPSGLFMEMGGYMTKGLALGIDAGARGPQRSMNRMMTGLATDAPQLAVPAPAIRSFPGGGARGGAGFAAAAAPGGDTIIHVYGAKGQDVEELARIVMRKIEDANGTKSRRTYEGDR
ncbi:phage tail tape measure protein [Sphingomonas sp.]|uniref:phage tail tape measure protein n=1 Tax=Sphingomonas sp. TaxID=28214 RepID=UPI003F701A67